MTALDERQQAYENKFMHDEELRFKATAAAVKKVTHEIAEKAGLSHDQIEALKTEVITNVLVVDGIADTLQFLYKKSSALKLTLQMPEIQAAFDHAYQSKMADLMGQKK